jgi:broad specificity phosphatase PhoE
MLANSAAVAALMCAMAVPAFAQETTSAIRGRITDSAGAAVAGATVTITHVPTGTTVTELAGLNEYSAGSLIRAHAAATGASLPEPGSGTPIDPRAFQRRLEEVGLLWAEGKLQAPGVESWQAFSDRVAAAIGEVMAREGRARRVVVSTSAGVVGAAVGHLLGLPPREAIKLSWSVHNSSVTRIQYDGARTSLLSFNAVPHLEHPERRSLLTYR